MPSKNATASNVCFDENMLYDDVSLSLSLMFDRRGETLMTVVFVAQGEQLVRVVFPKKVLELNALLNVSIIINTFILLVCQTSKKYGIINNQIYNFVWRP